MKKYLGICLAALFLFGEIADAQYIGPNPVPFVSNATGNLPPANGGFTAVGLNNANNSLAPGSNATQSEIGYGVSGSSGTSTNTQITYRNPAWFPYYSKGCRVVWVNGGFSSGLVQTGQTGTILVDAGLEFPAGSLTTPITFDGNKYGVLPSGGTLVSDVIPVDITAGGLAYVRATANAPVGSKWSWNGQGSTLSTSGSNGTDSAYSTGALGTGLSGANEFTYSRIVCSPNPTTSGSWYIAGNSIEAGTGDSWTGAPVAWNGTYQGWIVRGLANGPNSVPYAFTFTPVGGTTIAERVNPTLAPAITAGIDGNDYAIVGLHNDITTGTLATTEALFTQYFTMLANRGLKVYAATVTPTTSSTDNWQTTTNQGFSMTVNVASATNASPIVIATGASHFLTTGQTTTVFGVGGNTAANGTWVVTVVDSTHFSLNGSTGNGVYTSGGKVSSGETNREAINTWLRTVPAPLSGIVDDAATVEVNSSNVSALNGGYWTSSAYSVTGTATSGTSSTVSDTTKTWTTNQWAGDVLWITGGTCSGHSASIFSNTATQVTAFALGCASDATSTYAIGPECTIDGTHPSGICHALMAVPMAALAATLPGRQ